MARIAVLDHHQKETDRPRTFVKRSVGKTLVRRALAYWVRPNAILRMLPNAMPVRMVNAPAAGPSHYIPEKMPTGEIGGIYFDDPVKQPIVPRLIFLRRADRSQQYEL